MDILTFRAVPFGTLKHANGYLQASTFPRLPPPTLSLRVQRQSDEIVRKQLRISKLPSQDHIHARLASTISSHEIPNIDQGFKHLVDLEAKREAQLPELHKQKFLPGPPKPRTSSGRRHTSASPSKPSNPTKSQSPYPEAEAGAGVDNGNGTKIPRTIHSPALHDLPHSLGLEQDTNGEKERKKVGAEGENIRKVRNVISNVARQASNHK